MRTRSPGRASSSRRRSGPPGPEFSGDGPAARATAGRRSCRAQRRRLGGRLQAVRRRASRDGRGQRTRGLPPAVPDRQAESAPPDRATTRAIGHVGRSVDTVGQLLQAARLSHRGGSAILPGWAASGDVRHVSASQPASFHLEDDLTHLVLAHLHLQAHQPERCVRGSERRALRAGHAGMAEEPAPIRSMTRGRGPRELMRLFAVGSPLLGRANKPKLSRRQSADHRRRRKGVPWRSGEAAAREPLAASFSTRERK